MTQLIEPHFQTTVPARYYALLPALLADHGIDAQKVLVNAKISIKKLMDPLAELTIAELERIVRSTIDEGGKALPLELGSKISMGDHAVVGYAVLSSPTVGYALRLITRFFRLVFPAFRMRYQEINNTLEVSFTPTVAMSSECLAFNIELIALAAHTDIKELVRNKMPDYVMELSIPAPSYSKRYKELMPTATVKFRSLDFPGLRLVLPASILNQKPTLANPASLVLAEQRCKQLTERIVTSRDVGEWTKMMLRDSNDGLPSIEELAASLNINSRTLHRYLKREGLVYRTLCVEERNRRALTLLSKTNLSITRIALELGYSDSSNFTRAFRAYHGFSPSAYREKVRQTSPEAT